jgi:4-hydroxybenzoate polyprenyltransferase
MEQFKLFIELTRLKKPIGYMLLFWPCAWGLTLAYDFSDKLNLYFFYLLLFFFGSVLMRSAGCIVNDIFDRKFDAKVLRTKNRPIASGKISVTVGIIYSAILCLLALFVLINFNKFTILLGIGSMPFAFSYPLMKRFTYWPQLFLGVTFNYGIILGWSSIFDEINFTPIILYLGAIFWTLAFDTIYGFQDIKDDEIIGIKSTSIKFKNNPYLFIKLCYSIFLISIICVGYLLNFNQMYFILVFICIIYIFYSQIYKLNVNDASVCLKVFKSNNFLGFIIFFCFLMGKLL